MKKVISMILCFILTLSLCACNEPIEDEPAPEVGFSETIPVTAEKTAYNYLTGEFNMATDRVSSRPVCIQINNNEASWPQSGLSQADIVIEGETEGGITRIDGLYTDVREVAKIGNPRMMRPHLIEVAYPVDPIYGCIWSDSLANELIETKHLDVLDGAYVSGFGYFDKERAKTYATEHCYYTSGARIDSAIKEQSFRETSKSKLTSFFHFADIGQTITPAGGKAQTVHFYYSGNETYDGDYRYDETTRKYLKFQHGDPQIDVGTGDRDVQLAFQNVLILFANHYSLETASRLVAVDYQAGGTGYYFSNGRYEEFTWSKADFESGFVFTKSDGSELVVNTGKTMMCIVDRQFSNTLEIQ